MYLNYFHRTVVNWYLLTMHSVTYSVILLSSLSFLFVQIVVRFLTYHDFDFSRIYVIKKTFKLMRNRLNEAKPFINFKDINYIWDNN